MKKMLPMTFGLIEEGRLAAALDEAVLETGRKLIAHVVKYGPDAAKAKAEVTLKLTFENTSIEDGTYVISGKVDSKTPGRPVRSTMAIHEQEQTGEDALFVRASGSSDDSPRQQRLATDDGRGVDPKTGRPIPPRPQNAEGE